MIDIITISTSLIALVIAGLTLKKQYEIGKLKISPIASFGIASMGEDYGPPDGLLIVLPVLFYSTGNGIFGINDLRLLVRDAGADHYFEVSHFTKGVGSNPLGAHKEPDVDDWFHQFIVHPKTSTIKYIKFVGMFDARIYRSILMGKSLKIFLEAKTTQKDYFHIMQSFGIKDLQLKCDTIESNYVVYENDLYS